MPASPTSALARGTLVSLRPFESGDAESLRALERARLGLPRARLPARLSSGEPSARPAPNRLRRPPSRKLAFALVRNEDGRLTGCLTLAGALGGVMQSAFVGYWIGAPFARRGYMTEGLRLLADLAFARLELHRLEALILPDNEASRRLVAKAGFRFEGVARRLIRCDGVWRDHERWALTVEDVEAARSS